LDGPDGVGGGTGGAGGPWTSRPYWFRGHEPADPRRRGARTGCAGRRAGNGVGAAGPGGGGPGRPAAPGPGPRAPRAGGASGPEWLGGAEDPDPAHGVGARGQGAGPAGAAFREEVEARSGAQPGDR